MKSLKKVLLVAILFFILFNIVIQENVFAANIMQNITTMAGNAADPNASGAVNSVTNIAGAVVTIARVVAAGVAIIMITVLAMKYMTAAPSEKADVKKHAIPYIVGAIIMFSVTGILGIIQDFTKVLD